MACVLSLVCTNAIAATAQSVPSDAETQPGRAGGSDPLPAANPAPNPAPKAAPVAEPLPPPPIPVPRPWWQGTGDAVLAGLVEQGLSADLELVCRVAHLRTRDREAGKKSLGSSLKRLFAARDAEARDRAAREAAVSRVADRRAALARDIALAYVDLRRLQQLHTLRAGVLDEYKDNAEIAEFRRQAGLASTVDGALAATQNETARAELGYIDGRLPDALAELARLTRVEPATLSARVGEGTPLPPALLDGPDAQQDNGREAALSEAIEAAKRTARDARTAYREGAGNMATVYVAEAAALSVEQALADARAVRAAATVRQWSNAGQAWARADIEDPARAATTDQTVAAGCE